MTIERPVWLRYNRRMRIKLTDNGPEVSRIVHGMMRLKDWDIQASELVSLIERSIGLGVTTFDHADIYGGYSCEQLFGEALKEEPSLRGRIEIITKCGIMLDSGVKHYDTSARHIKESVENSLRNLGTDRIDILLIHRPDPLMNPEEIASAFDSLKESGKVLHFGVSNFTPSQYDLLSSYVIEPLVTNQVECSVLHLDPFEDGTLDRSTRHRSAPMAWSPLAGGRLLTGDSERAGRVRDILLEIGGSVAAAAIAWLLRHPSGIVPVVGTGNPERLEEAVKALESDMTREEWFQIWTGSKGHEVP